MATKEEKKRIALILTGIPGLGALIYLLLRRRAAADGNGNGNGNGVVGLTIERFFVVTIPKGDDGEFDAHCHIKNTSGSEITSQLHCIGQIFIAGGQLIREIDEVESFTLAPGEVYDYKYGWFSVKGDDVWVQVIGDWGEQTPRLDFVSGYHSYDPVEYVELKCTAVGSDYAILRYSQRSVCSKWDFSCRTPPPPAEAEQSVSYSTLRLGDSWASISHAMLGLLPGRQYRGVASGGPVANRTGRTIFNTLGGIGADKLSG